MNETFSIYFVNDLKWLEVKVDAKVPKNGALIQRSSKICRMFSSKIFYEML